jgi:hypothetical protein
MRTPLLTLLAGWMLLASGCVEPFEGSHVQFSLDNVDQPCQVLLLNQLTGQESCKDASGQPLSRQDQRFVGHYEMWATVNDSAAVYLMSFTVQPHLFPAEEIELDKERIELSNGKTFVLGGQSGKSYNYDMTAEEKAITDTQMGKASTVKAITSFSDTMFEDPNAPPPRKLVKDFYLGSHTQLSLAHNGEYYGQVKKSHPYGAITLDGASVRVAPNLENLDSMWITIELGDPDRPDPKPSKLIYLRGSAEQKVRGVINVEATSPIDPQARAAFGVLPALGEEEYF